VKVADELERIQQMEAPEAQEEEGAVPEELTPDRVDQLIQLMSR
jgi:hypothetical protein